MLNVRPFIALSSCLLLFACGGSTPEPPPQADSVSTGRIEIRDEGDTTTVRSAPAEVRTVPFNENGPRYTWTISPAPNGTYGFSIYDRGQLYIHQLKATGLGGPDGWKTKVDARTAALSAMEKLEKGEVPEGLTIVSQE